MTPEEKVYSYIDRMVYDAARSSGHDIDLGAREDAEQTLADARCACCTEGDDMAMILDGMDELIRAYVARAYAEDPVLAQMLAVRQAMAEAL